MKIVGIKKIKPFGIYDITVEGDHCFELFNGIIAHNSLYPKDIMSGGTGGMYSANQVFIITKAQEKDGTELTGYKFTINIEKSRYVREKSKFPFIVHFDGGINRWSGLLDIALEGKFVVKPSMGWYSKANPLTGSVEDKKYRAKDTDNYDFWKSILENEDFCEFVKNRYQIGRNEILKQEDNDIDREDDTI